MPIAILVSLALAQVVNPSFEQGEVGAVPTGWAFPEIVAADGYRAERTREGTVVLRSTTPTVSFGTLLQRVDAEPYRGKRIRLSGRVRSRPGAGPNGAQLWLRVDRTGNAPGVPYGRGFFDNMKDRPVTSRAWTNVEIVGPVADDASTLVLGLLLSGKGEMEADDLHIDVLGPADEGNTPPSPVSEAGVDNLAALARLSGVVELFHPSEESRSAEWTRLLAGAAPSVEKARDAADLAARLQTIMEAVAPTVVVWAGGPEQAPAWVAPQGRLRFIEHHGLGPEWTGMDPERTVYYSLVRTRAAKRLPDGARVVVVPLGAGVTARVPLALMPTARPDTPAFAATGPEGWAPSDADRGSRLAAVMRTWSILRHFYPYDAAVDWDAELRRALMAAAEGPDFQRVLQRLVASIQDGHGYAGGHERLGYTLPVSLTQVAEGAAVARAWVAADTPDASTEALRPGDVIVVIDGVAVPTMLADLRAHTSFATEGWARYVTLSALVLRDTGAPVPVTVERLDGTVEETLITPVPASEARKHPAARPDQGAELAQGIRYLDLTTVTEDELDTHLPSLVVAAGVVIDMRGYPGTAAITLLRHLASHPFQSARWMVPKGVRPFVPPTDWDLSRWQMTPLRPHIAGRVAFLTDAGAISYAESIMGIVEAEGLGTIVGEPTAGTNGNVVHFSPLRGYGVSFTGMRVLKHDGSPHHGIGIVPKIPAAPTRAGLASGVDEVLEEGLKAVR